MIIESLYLGDKELDLKSAIFINQNEDYLHADITFNELSDFERMYFNLKCQWKEQFTLKGVTDKRVWGCDFMVASINESEGAYTFAVSGAINII